MFSPTVRYIIYFKQVKSLAARETDVDLQVDTLEIKILLKNVSYNNNNNNNNIAYSTQIKILC